MTENRFVGSGLARGFAVALGLVTVALVTGDQAVWGYRFYAVLVAGVLTWLGVVHSSRALFRLWMRFAEALHTVAITTLFSLCYLVFVPVFRIILWRRDPLRLRKRPEDSGWVVRTARVDAASLERMG